MTAVDAVVARELTRPSKRRCLDFNMKGLRFVGLWPTSGDEKRNFLFYFRYIIPRIQLFRFSYSIIFQIINISLVWGNLSLMAEYLVQVVISAMSLVKCGSLFVYREQLKRIFDTFESLNDDKMIPDKQSQRRLVDFDRNVNRGSKFVIFSLIFVGLINTTSLIIEGLVTRTIPLRLWFPYDTRSSPLFEMTLVFTWTVALLDANMLFTTDVVFIVLMLHIVEQFQLLRYKLENTSTIAQKLYDGRNTSSSLHIPSVHAQSLVKESVINEMRLHPMGALANKPTFSGLLNKALTSGGDTILNNPARSIREILEDPELENGHRLNRPTSLGSSDMCDNQIILNNASLYSIPGDVDAHEMSDASKLNGTSTSYGLDVQLPIGGQIHNCPTGSYGRNSATSSYSRMYDVGSGVLPEIQILNSSSIIYSPRKLSNSQRINSTSGSVANGQLLKSTSASVYSGSRVLADSALRSSYGVGYRVLSNGQRENSHSENYDMRARVLTNSLGNNTLTDTMRVARTQVTTDQGMERYLKHCAQHHQTLLRQTHDIEHVFRISLAQQVIANGLCGILLLYTFLLAGEFNTKGFTFIGAFVACNTQFLAFCWLGNRLTDESVQVRDAVHGCDWFGASESFKRSMRIMITRSNTPVIMRAAGLPLCMSSFRFMCRGAYYFQMMIGKILRGDKIVQRKET